MDSINTHLREANICIKCRSLLDGEKNYNTHLKKCKGWDKDIITTRFYSQKELVMMGNKRKNKIISIGSSITYENRPSTR